MGRNALREAKSVAISEILIYINRCSLAFVSSYRFSVI